MSCFVLNDDRIKTLADAIRSLYNCGGPRSGDCYACTGIDIPEEMNRLIYHQNLKDPGGFGYADENKIAACLYAENVKAWNGRYHREDNPELHNAEWFSKVKSERLVDYDNHWDNGHFEITIWYFRLLKLAECYLYQLMESATYNGEVYKAIDALIENIKNAIVYNDPRYNRGGGWEV